MNEYFPDVPPIRYEGPESKNPLAFKVYDPAAKVGGRTMADHLKFAVCYWHTFKGTGSDPFGGPVYDRPWNVGSDPMEVARRTLDACFEFISKLGVKYWCFHDRDIAPEGDTIAETNKRLEEIVARAKSLQKATGIKLLWGTANLFSHPRYSHGAATNPDPRVFAHAAAQIRRALDATVELGGTGYVFWGGREGYVSLINTDMKREREQLARMMHMAVDYAKSIGFKGMFFIEPKPKEPSTHQYDFDAATALGFLKEFELEPYFQLNIEANHATLATHSFEHELRVASDAGKLGSLDINRGDQTVGWDTDQFPTNLYDAVAVMRVLLKQGGLKYGGLNFDAKVRRGSFDTVDLFHAHIGGMDTFAKGLLIAHRMKEDGVFEKFIEERYAGWKTAMGKKILAGKATLPELEEWAAKVGEPPRTSGRQEMLENIFNEYLFGLR
ncbi:MAG: xylose isomerase [Kiritimatiellae bacterium]|nr:xylose isomerase [Kiritimatiellia bacterium]MDW8457732.1 xylose isomerase [Verrucomicrobiota bacterium]